MKKGRHRRFEEARALKRSHEVDLADLFEDISDAPEGEHKPEHDAWADMAEEWDNKQSEASAANADEVEADDDSSEADEEPAETVDADIDEVEDAAS